MNDHGAPVDGKLFVNLRGEEGHRRACCGAKSHTYARCDFRSEGDLEATSGGGPRWRSLRLLCELACRVAGDIVVDLGHALAVGGVERYFRSVVPGWSNTVESASVGKH